MVRPIRTWHLVSGVLLFGGALLLGAALLLPLRDADPAIRSQALLVWGAIAGFVFLFLAGALALLHRFVLVPLEQFAREVHIIVHANTAHEIELPRGHLLGEVPEEVDALAAALWKARREIAEAVSASASELEHDKARLEDILQALGEAVLVCDEGGRIMFYNLAARRIFQENVALGLGRSLTLLFSAAPIESSLEILRRNRVRPQPEHAAGGDVSFVCSTVAGTLLNCRMRLLPAVPGLAWSFLLTCEDISHEAEAQGRRESLLRATVKEMRGPLANLSLGAESLELLPDLGTANRTALERAIREEARALVARFETLAREVEEIESPRYVIRDVLTEDLLAGVVRRLEGRGIRLTVIGEPLWVKADLQSLLFLLEYFAARIHEFCAVPAIEVETLLGDKRVYFAFSWSGPVVPQTEIQRWLAAVVDPPGVNTVAEVLERHGSEVWSKPHAVPGFAILTLPMPSSPNQWAPPRAPLPARPVYGDFAFPGPVPGRDGLEEVPLEGLTFVVFDTETTGLAPLEGDEIISLAGVKVVNRGIVVGESFDRLVDPGRAIPPSSVRFHGITDEMARGKPPIEAALRDFRAFVGDAVLVGHNAAFDLRFIQQKEARAGVVFRGPIVDTLSISRYLHDHTPEHSLDAIARRLGVDIRDRHTALGDSLITAQVFLKFIYLLQKRGVTTLRRLREVTQW